MCIGSSYNFSSFFTVPFESDNKAPRSERVGSKRMRIFPSVRERAICLFGLVCVEGGNIYLIQLGVPNDFCNACIFKC